MNFKINNTRELKSLHLLHKIKTLKNFFENLNSFGIFITAANLHPIARIETHEKFLSQNLKITKISHKLIKIIFKNQNTEILQHLLSGPIYLIENKNNNLILKDKLSSIFTQKNFILRFIYLNQQLYRLEESVSLLQNMTGIQQNDLIKTLKSKQIILF